MNSKLARLPILAAIVCGSFTVGVVPAATSAAEAQSGWADYRAETYGFSMLVPEGTVLAESEGINGWARLVGRYDGVHLYALTKRGEQATAEEIEAVGIALTGIPESGWRMIDSGRNQGGWNWYRTVEASQGGRLIFGGYGTGPTGSYLLLLETTEADYNANRADYMAWYRSIRLF